MRGSFSSKSREGRARRQHSRTIERITSPPGPGFHGIDVLSLLTPSAGCRSALNGDPRSAPKRDSFGHENGAGRERARRHGARQRAGGLCGSGSAFESPAIVAGLDDVAVARLVVTTIEVRSSSRCRQNHRDRAVIHLGRFFKINAKREQHASGDQLCFRLSPDSANDQRSHT